jgi:hypothetical protein
MAKLVNLPENIPITRTPNPLQIRESPKAVVPCFSLAPLRVRTSKNMERMAITTSKITVRTVEIAAEDLLGAAIVMVVSPIDKFAGFYQMA